MTTFSSTVVQISLHAPDVFVLKAFGFAVGTDVGATVGRGVAAAHATGSAHAAAPSATPIICATLPFKM